MLLFVFLLKAACSNVYSFLIHFYVNFDIRLADNIYMNKAMALKNELKFYETNKAEYLKHYEGKYALIKGNELVGTFDSEEHAFNAGVDKFGVQPFLIKQICEKEKVEHIPAITAHLAHANS